MRKIILGLLIIFLMLLLGNIIFSNIYSASSKVVYGVSFSPKYAQYLKLDWQQVYLQLINDLKVKNIRIPSYWDITEPQKGQYDFSQIDFMVNEAAKKGAKVILVLGARQPRWPECHTPVWVKNLTVASRQQQALEFIKIIVDRYKGNNAIWAWQVENEPFAFWFGENCDTPDSSFLQREIEIVKKIDPKRLIMITDSGEWSSWVDPMKYSDLLGVSLYRKAFNDVMNSYITYPFPAWMYPLKSDLVKKLFAFSNTKTIISELQAEPWLKKGVLETSVAEQLNLFSIKDFQSNIEYAKKTGFDSIYLWGVEWWYFMADKGRLEYLEYAKSLF